MDTYRIRLAGEPLPGHTPQSIAEALLRQFKLRPAQVQTMLPPARRVLKAGLSEAEADRLHRLLQAAGLAVHKERHVVDAALAASPSTPIQRPATPATTAAPRAARTAATPRPARVAPAATAPTVTVSSESDLAAALAPGFARRRPGSLYALHLLLVTLGCVLVPLTYLAAVIAFGYGLGWYLYHVHDVTGWHLHGFWPIFGLYVLPAASGGIVLLFLLRPMWPAGSGKERSLPLDPEEEPRLLQTIQVLADAIGIRPPAMVRLSHEVNASVHFAGGWAGFFSGRKVLTIGLPLVAGLSSQQLLGVLAHEFGHFAQRFGMRCSFLVNHVNAWLYQRAYVPDPWLERVARWAEDNDEVVVRIVMRCASLGVKVSRGLLAGLFQLSFRLSRSLSRQMEFDADSYEVRLAGSAAFADTALRLRALARAFGEVDQRNAGTWREHKLLRDVPQAVALQVDGYDEAAWARLRRGLGHGITRYWDSHPADLERVRHAQDLQAPGLFRDTRPAATLFERFGEHCRDVTRAYYRLLGLDIRNAELCEPEAVTRLADQRADARAELERWTGRQWHPSPWLPLHQTCPDDVRTQAWQACVDELRLHSPTIVQDWARAGQETERRARIAFAGLLHRHDLAFPVSGAEAFDEQRHVDEYQRIIDWQTPARVALKRTAALYRRRIELALEGSELRSEPLLALAALQADVETLHEAWIVACQFKGQGDTARHEGLERIHHDAAVACQEHALRLLRKCDDITQTLLEGGSLGGYLRRRCPRVAQDRPEATDFVAVAGVLLDSLRHAWQVAFADMAQRCLQAERARGMTGIMD